MGFSVTDLISRIGVRNQSNSISSSTSRMASLLSSSRASSLSTSRQEVSPATTIQSRASSVTSAMQSISDNLSKTVVADNALGKISDVTNRMSELAKQSASESMTDNGRAILNAQYQDLRKEVDKIAAEASYLDGNLLDGSGSILMVVGNSSSAQSQYNNYSVREISSDALGLGTDISTKESADQSVTQLEDASNIIRSTKGDIDSVKKRLENNLESYNSLQVNTAAGSSRIQILDEAENVSLSARSSILQQTGTAMVAQANISAQQVMQYLS